MDRNYVETVMGGVVIVAAGLFLVFAYTTANIKPVKGYTITAKFDSIDGIQKGSDIRLAGIKVGTVVGQELDPETYFAVVRMNITHGVRLPSDTSATITADGLLGDKFLSLTPGGAEDMIPDGGEITTTQGSVDLMGLVGKMLFSTGDDEPKGDGK